MDKVTVRTAELAEIMRHNRDQHRQVFEKALEIYRARAIEELDRLIADLRKGHNILLHVGLPRPEDHTKDYNRVIKMLELHIGDTIEIAQPDFAMYAMDDWHWKAGWTASTASYLVTGGD